MLQKLPSLATKNHNTFFDSAIAAINDILTHINNRKADNNPYNAYNWFWNGSMFKQEEDETTSLQRVADEFGATIPMEYESECRIYLSPSNYSHLRLLHKPDGSTFYVTFNKELQQIQAVEDIERPYQYRINTHKQIREKEYWLSLAEKLTGVKPNVSYLDLMKMDWQEALELMRLRMEELKEKKI